MHPLLFAWMIATATPTRPSRSEFPMVSHLHPFTTETRHLSLPGYLRFLVYQRDGYWLTHREAMAVVEEQQAAASR